mgnify:FL=1
MGSKVGKMGGGTSYKKKGSYKKKPSKSKPSKKKMYGY